MQMLQKNSSLIKRCILIGLAALIVIISIVMFSLSFEIYDDGYGTDISFDMDYIVLMCCGIALLVYGILDVISYRRQKSTRIAFYSCFGVISSLLSFYPLGVFFKAISKGKPYLENQEYLYIGIIGLFMLAYILFSYLSTTKYDAQD